MAERPGPPIFGAALAAWGLQPIWLTAGVV
jgi:hypothetical protein